MSSNFLQFSPQVSTRVIRIQPIPERWMGESANSSEFGFIQLWIQGEPGIAGARINWGAISGLAISLAVSAVFWMGVAGLVERIWK